MAWDYGTITDANPADALMDKIEGCMTDPAWTFEEELTPAEMGGTSGLGRIWDNSNGFHIAIEVYETTHYVKLYLAEGYNASTNKCIRPALISSQTVGADYSYGNGAEYTWAMASPYSAGTVNTTGFTYAISATANYLYVATLVGSTVSGVHAGKFDTLMTSDPGPYYITALSSVDVGSTIGGHTRVPNGSGSQSFGGALVSHTGEHGTPGSYDATHAAIVISRIRVQNRGNADTHRGLLKGVVAAITSGSYAFGDELDVSGTPKYKVLYAVAGASGVAIEMV
jgi:hypothetical protein